MLNYAYKYCGKDSFRSSKYVAMLASFWSEKVALLIPHIKLMISQSLPEMKTND